MNRREFVISTFAGVAALFEVAGVAGQAKTITPDLGALADKKRGLVGLWAGNNSGGDFANLTIVPAA